MRNAETMLAIIRERGNADYPWRTSIDNSSTRTCTSGLRAHLPKRRGHDPGRNRGNRGRDVTGEDRAHHRDCSETSGIDGPRCDACYIPRRSGKMRPLGIPTWSDKLLQEVMRSILEAYYEPQFSRPTPTVPPGTRMPHRLAGDLRRWTGTKWFIEGDIKGCFDNIDHTVLLSILREKIHDNRFLSLVENLLKAGYLEEWDYRPTLSGTPQGGVSAHCSRTSTWTGSTGSSNRTHPGTPEGPTSPKTGNTPAYMTN